MNKPLTQMTDEEIKEAVNGDKSLFTQAKEVQGWELDIEHREGAEAVWMPHYTSHLREWAK